MLKTWQNVPVGTIDHNWWQGLLCKVFLIPLSYTVAWLWNKIYILCLKGGIPLLRAVDFSNYWTNCQHQSHHSSDWILSACYTVKLWICISTERHIRPSLNHICWEWKKLADKMIWIKCSIFVILVKTNAFFVCKY